MGFYVTTTMAIRRVSKAFWNPWNAKKAMEILEKGKDSVEPGKFEFHMHHSGVLEENQLARALRMRVYTTGRAFAIAGLLVIGFNHFVQFKNMEQ